MSETPLLSEQSTRLLGEARDWRLLGLLFERPRSGWHREVAALAEATDDEALRTAARAARDADEGSYLACMGPGGMAPAREAGYRRAADPSETIAWLQAAYRAFSYAPSVEDPPDHLALICGFRGWLALKQSYALAIGDVDTAASSDALGRRIAREHLAMIAEPLAERLGAGEGGHLLAAARALVARVGPRPHDVEGGWVPEGLDGGSCSAVCGAEATDDLGGAILDGIEREVQAP